MTTEERADLAIEALAKKYGSLTKELLHHNEMRGHLVYLLKTESGDKFVLKVLGENFGIAEGIKKEIDNRVILHRELDKAGISNVAITEIIESNQEEDWSLAKFEEFKTLLEIYKENREEFRRVIFAWYDEVLIPLLEKLPPDTELPGDYSLDDIGYRDNKFYLYDIEKNKTLLKVAVDVYGKLIHWYAKQKGCGDEVEFLENLIAELRTKQRKHVPVDDFNAALKERLESPVLQDVLAGREAETLKQFRL